METFSFILPSPLLSPYIKHYWILKINETNPISERIIPTGFMQLVFHRGDKMKSLTHNKLQPQSFICGQSDSYTNLESTGKVNMIVVVFHPFGAKTFFPMSMNEFYGMNISLKDLGDQSLKELEERIHETPDNYEAIKLIEEYLTPRLYRFDNYNSKRISKVIDSINSKHQPNITQLSNIACLSYKQFNRIFTEYVGVTPKEFTRIIRFQRTLYMLQQNPNIDIMQIIVDCGYYDQSHLIKEFRNFSGYTPFEFIAIYDPYSDYFS
ncbi:AraC family transcriptional regulator [Dysgonomonas sp. Marseille-P4677]|uniref:AraC family transcriptional regulator n=1 Tax=Dysgonomonas sp. Marseille-P4677 TaxID=2364790 RepID=UPI0019129CCE|nr:helix-turn-helix domain-containing protein [Dysgonomonas sp. Marseille-P4677]MBK5720454.1 AraC family transcriptional regulator [Dysgonomonas sp. Marseille-P4677]